MSNYNIPSSVDIKSTSIPGTINVYNPSGTNYVSVTAPSTLSGNVDFTLPSTAGTVGQYLQRTGPTSLGWGTPIAFVNSPIPYATISVQSSSLSRITTTSTTYQNIIYFPFPGTAAYSGFLPSSIFVLIGASNNTTTIELRVQDITNVTTIATATSTTFVANSINAFSLGTLSNIPSSAAVWQIQIRRASGTGTLHFYGFTILG